MTIALKHGTLDLTERRSVGFALYGAEDGYPVVVCHGTPGSRLILQLAAEFAHSAGLCLIVPDRPGYGLSSHHRHKRLIDWSRDLAMLVDHLGHRHFAIIGISGGGPFALGVASAMPERVTRLQVISGLAPLSQADVLRSLDPKQRTMTRAMRGGSVLLQSVLKLASGGLHNLPDSLLQRVMRLAPGANGPLSANPLAQQSMMDSFREAFRHGSEGLGNDLALFNQPWGFSIKQVEVPVRLWHGEEDAVVPVGMGRYLAKNLPACEATFMPEAGHYWVIENLDLVLGTLKKSLLAVD